MEVTAEPCLLNLCLYEPAASVLHKINLDAYGVTFGVSKEWKSSNAKDGNEIRALNQRESSKIL